MAKLELSSSYDMLSSQSRYGKLVFDKISTTNSIDGTIDFVHDPFVGMLVSNGGFSYSFDNKSQKYVFNGELEGFGIIYADVNSSASAIIYTIDDINMPLQKSVDFLTKDGVKIFEEQILLGNDEIKGSSGNDYLIAYSGNDWVYGNSGNDVIDGGSGEDNLFGGKGSDTYYVDNVKDKISEDITDKDIDSVYSSVNYFALGGIENIYLIGTKPSNATGNQSDNVLKGSVSKNTLVGNDGNDYLSGGAGKDTLTGGNGKDIFAFNTLAKSSDDKITDFHSGLDKIEIDSSVFKSLNNSFSKGSYIYGKKAIDFNDYFIFDSAKGKLFYDEDGNGPTKSLLIATLVGVNTLQYEDFSIV